MVGVVWETFIKPTNPTLDSPTPAKSWLSLWPSKTSTQGDGVAVFPLISTVTGLFTGDLVDMGIAQRFSLWFLT